MTETSSSYKSTPLGKIMLFAFPRVGSTIFLNIVDGAILLLYAFGFGLNESDVSFMISLGYIAVGLSQFFFGWISDISYTKKWGARKPYIFVLSLLLAVSAIFLLMPQLVIDPSNLTLMLGWLALWLVLFKISYAVTTPYQSWMMEQFNVQDRPKVSQVQNQFNFIGQIIVALFGFLVMTNVTKYYKDPANDPTIIPLAFLISIIIFAVIFVGSFYTSAILMPVEAPPLEKTKLGENFRSIFRNRRFLLLLLMQGLASIAWVIAGTVILPILNEVLLFGTAFYMIAAGTLVLASLFFLWIWRLIMKRAGKTRSIRWVFLAGVFVMPFSLIPLLNLANPIIRLIYGVLFVLGYAGVLAGWYVFSYIIYADLAQDDYRVTKKNKAGLYTGFPSITLNLFQAFGTFLLGLLFKLGEVSVGAFTFDYALVIWGPFVAIVLLGVFFYTRTYINLDYEWEQKIDVS